MITQLRAPLVCVIDDEPDDYEPIMDALVGLGIACLHVKGQTTAQVPPKPIRGLRVVFTDLHLSGHVGKDAASHCANVFSKVVSPDTAPLIVVIWSKYSDDTTGNAPKDDTEAELFKKTLIESFPVYSERLVFMEMKKPKLPDRPSKRKWITQLKRQIRNDLAQWPEFQVLWAWEAFVREAASEVTAALTTLAMPPKPNTVPPATLPERLRQTIRLLVREQGGPQCSNKLAPKHLATVLGQSLVDHLEYMDGDGLSQFGAWLNDRTGLPKSTSVAAGINSFLLSCDSWDKAQPFMPGNVYRLSTPAHFQTLFGVTLEGLVRDVYAGAASEFENWKAAHPAVPVMIEVSPACDVHQSTRRNAMLVGGLVFPAAAKKRLKRADAIELLPSFHLRWPIAGMAEQPVLIAVFCRLKTTMRPLREPRWLIPWFRLRELPTASLRNWFAGHAARVGYVSLASDQ